VTKHDPLQYKLYQILIVPIGVGTTRRTDRKRLKGGSEEPRLAAIATTAPIVGKKAREASGEFEADRLGDFAQASNEQEEPSHGNALKNA